VRHAVVKRVVDLTHLLGELQTSSRDFHCESWAAGNICTPQTRAILRPKWLNFLSLANPQFRC
jgi:hypothetical protein